MQFTIEKDLTIKGTRGETGTIHITFDRDMTGTKGVFLVKRKYDTSDTEAFLVKNFVFGSNPAISGKEIIISITRSDTENMPILLPDSPYVFSSDYKDIECANYVWAIKLGSSCYTETVIPRPGTTYPTFRLYNEAYFDRNGTPVIPHPPFPSPDIYATKKDLIHYAATQKQLTDQLSGGLYELSGNVRLGFLNMAERHLSDIDGLDRRIDKLEEEHHDIPGIIVTLSGLQSVVEGQTAAIGVLGAKVTGMEKSVTSAVERSLEAADAALEARESVVVLASSVEAQLATFTDMFITSGGDLDYGVDAKKVFVKDYWKVDPIFPVLGAAMPALGAVDVSRDMITVDEAVRNLDDVDRILSSRISEISSGVGPELGVLSGNVVKEFVAVRGEITALSSDAKAYTDDKYEQGMSVVSGLGVEVMGSISALSANAKLSDDALLTRIGDAVVGFNTGIATLSSCVDDAFDTVRGEITSLSSNAKNYSDALYEHGMSVVSGMRSEIDSSISSLSGNSKAADERLASFIAGFQTDVHDRFVVLSGHVHNAIRNLSGSVSNEFSDVRVSISSVHSGLADEISSVSTACFEAISSLSGNSRTADESLNGAITSLSSGVSSEIGTLSANTHAAITSLSSSVFASISTLSGNASSADASLATALSTLSGDANSAIGAVASNVTSLSGYAKTADESVANSVVALSGNAKTSDEILANRISELSGSSIGDLSVISARITQLSSDASSADGNLHSEITTLSANSKSYVEHSCSSAYANAVADSVSSIHSFIDDEYTPWIIEFGNGIVVSSLGAAASGDAILSSALRAEIERATGAEDEKIAKASIIESFATAPSDNKVVPGAKATYEFVNSSINNMAAYYITKNAAGDAFATKSELNSAIASGQFYNAGKIRVPTRNDYCVVLKDEDHVDKGLTPTTRYVYDGANWAFQYVINATVFTQGQIDALNSGVTSGFVVNTDERISSVSSNLNRLSADYVLKKESDIIQFTNIESSIVSLSEDFGETILNVSDSLRGLITSNVSTLNGSISTLSGNAKSDSDAIRVLVSTLSGNAFVADGILANGISTLSSNAKSADDAISTSISSLSGNASSADAELLNNISSLSGNAKSADSDLALSITTLSGNASSADATIVGLIATLSGNTSSADVLLAANISELSGFAKTSDDSLSTRIGNISGYAKTCDETLATRIANISGYAKTCDETLAKRISTISGYSKTTDDRLASSTTALSGYAVNYESRIKSFEESRYFDSVSESRMWCKGYISGLVFKADGTMDDDASRYSDKQVLKLVLGIVQKLAADDHYFESQAQANAWVKGIIPLIQLNANGTMKDSSEYTDEEVLKLVLAIVNKMATLH